MKKIIILQMAVLLISLPAASFASGKATCVSEKSLPGTALLCTHNVFKSLADAQKAGWTLGTPQTVFTRAELVGRLLKVEEACDFDDSDTENRQWKLTTVVRYAFVLGTENGKLVRIQSADAAGFPKTCIVPPQHLLKFPADNAQEIK